MTPSNTLMLPLSPLPAVAMDPGDAGLSRLCGDLGFPLTFQEEPSSPVGNQAPRRAGQGAGCHAGSRLRQNEEACPRLR